MISENYTANAFRTARVTYVYPEGQAVDVIFLDNGEYGRHVQVLSPMAGTDFGFTSGIPRPEQEGHAPNVRNNPDQRHVEVLVGMGMGRYFAVGFIPPQVTEMAFTREQDPDRMIERHPSDFYRTIDTDANMDMVHPSGAFIRMGAGLEPTDLTGRDFDGRWKIKHNTGGQPNIVLGNGGSTITMYANGDITVHAKGQLRLESEVQVVTEAPQIFENTEIHITTGTHIDERGVHCPTCP